ncbi:MAG TPA: hypothetical protein VKR61_20305 [Bryobacteraceae bacterium]|nr:hypothetical protein [Bryobacteraceae bacterium]
MCAEFTDTAQFEALSRIAVFSAGVRGHQLAAWQAAPDSATAKCVVCGLSVTVRASLWEPGMDGAALETSCKADSRDRVA